MVVAAKTPEPSVSSSAIFDLERYHSARGWALMHRLAGRGAIETGAFGPWISLSDGTRMLDFGSYAVTLLGHRHPAVVAAVHSQLDQLPTSTRSLANEIGPSFMARLVDTVDDSRLQRVWLGQNGADVVECALKLARLATGRTKLLAVKGGYHGKSFGALAVTWLPRYRRPFESILPEVTHLDPANPDAGCAEIARGDAAALIFEPVQGEGGVNPLDPAVLRAWSNCAQISGTMLIADEIQCGLGRCGPIALSLDQGLAPNAVLFGKALGGGVMPLSAMVADDRLFAPLEKDPFLHTCTFSGHPLSAAAGIAALEVIKILLSEGMVAGEQFGRELTELSSHYEEVVIDTRGVGLFWSIECRTNELAGELIASLADAGLLVSPCLGHPRTIRLLPPLVAQHKDFEIAIQVIEAALTRCQILNESQAENRKKHE